MCKRVYAKISSISPRRLCTRRFKCRTKKFAYFSDLEALSFIGCPVSRIKIVLTIIFISLRMIFYFQNREKSTNHISEKYIFMNRNFPIYFGGNCKNQFYC